jgi:hypothetical protein
MLQTLADMLDAAPSASDRFLIWLRTALDLPISLAAQQLEYAGDVLTHETPSFVRRNAFISALLFLPFFVIAITNDMDAHRFYHTWLWQLDVLFTWILLLPTLGMLLSIASLFFWLRTSRRSWWHALRDVSHNWMMLLPIALGIGIILLLFLHDSVQCIAGSPLRELRNVHATLRCVEQR